MSQSAHVLWPPRAGLFGERQSAHVLWPPANRTHWTTVTETSTARTVADGEFVLVDAPTCTVTLPAPTVGARVAVKVISAVVTDIQIRTNGSGVDIDGTDYSSTGLALTGQYEQINLLADGADWWIY